MKFSWKHTSCLVAHKSRQNYTETPTKELNDLHTTVMQCYALRWFHKSKFLVSPQLIRNTGIDIKYIGVIKQVLKKTYIATPKNILLVIVNNEKACEKCSDSKDCKVKKYQQTKYKL